MSELIAPSPGLADGDGLEPSDILALDQLAAAAWPAPYQTQLESWTIRYSDVATRRANSVATWRTGPGSISLIEHIEAVEDFYRQRGQPPRFQMSPAAEPDELDDELAMRGYEIEAPVTIQIANASSVARATPSKNVTVLETGSDEWWALYASGFNRDARDIAANAQETTGFAVIDGGDGQPASIGLGVIGAGWLGVFGMLTKPEMRGGGLGMAILGGLASWAVDRGVKGIYLQVENHNARAKRLYAKAGFRTAYGYYYRTKWPE